jgi:hypothetical protein
METHYEAGICVRAAQTGNVDHSHSIHVSPAPLRFPEGAIKCAKSAPE